MSYDSVADRSRLAHKIADLKQPVAQAISDEIFSNHPEWADRDMQRDRQFCMADACLHIEFLSGAIEAGSPETFVDYSRWTARMLVSRGVDAQILEESLERLERMLAGVLLPDEHDTVSAFLTPTRKTWKELEPASNGTSTQDGLDLTRKIFLEAILDGQRMAALSIVEEALQAGHSYLDIYVNVFAESLRRVGELWELNRISIGQEHVATSITQYALATIYPRLVRSGVQRGSMVVTGVSGELHQIGANIVADAMEANGWRVSFLGANVPHSAVVAAVEEGSASALCISTTMTANFSSVADLVQTVRGKLGGLAPKIILGGAAYRLVPKFASEVGAAGVFTDLRRAIAILCP